MRSLPFFFLLLPAIAHAELPLPVQADCSHEDGFASCPQEAGGNWTHFGHVPESIQDLRPQELPHGIGNAVLPAWRLSTGRFDVIVSVGDSGIDWSTRDLVNKVRLNQAELPLPQDATGATSVYDRNGDGLVNVQDWAQDPRVDPLAGYPPATFLDPSDLLAAFSDGVDDDGNGFVDDIAGWDFHEDDNDPGVTNLGNFGDHGNGVMRNAVGEGNNGGNIGVCPNCSLLPLRIGDSFIATGATLAQAVAYATAAEVDVLGLAVGGLTNPPQMQAVMAEAWARGVLIVAAAGDETSFHRNYPAVNDHALYVYSMAASDREWTNASSFQRFVNCNNFGPRLQLGAITRNSCATGAVSYIAGAAGLLQSLALDTTGERLSPGQLEQVLLQTATDVDVPESREPNDDLYPSYPGWDQHFGHGKLHAARAAQAVADGAIPPVAAITSPGWFDFVAPAIDRTDGAVQRAGPTELVVDARLGGPGAWSWVLEAGVGSDVPADAWVRVGGGDGEGLQDLELARVPVSSTWTPPVEASGCAGEATEGAWQDAVAALGLDPTYAASPLDIDDGVLGRLARLDPYGLTLRLTVTDAAGLVGTARKHLFVRRDERLLHGFPLDTGTSVESSPALADFDGDGVLEVVFADGAGRVHVVTGSGAPLAGWPQRVGLHPAVDPQHPSNKLGGAAADLIAGLHQDVLGSVAVGDLLGDSAPEVVVATLSGAVHAWAADGTPLPGFPVFMDFEHCDPADRDEDVRTDCGFAASPTLADIDGDGAREILQPGMDMHLYAWKADGTPLPGWPVFVQDPSFDAIASRVTRILSSPAVGDLDGDGDVEIVLGTSQTAGSDFGGYGMLYALDHDGALLPGWPLALFAGFAGALPYIGEGVVVSPALADIDGDGDLEIGATAIAEQGSLYHHDGTPATDFRATAGDFGDNSNSDEQAALFMVGSGAFTDADGDGLPDWFAGGSGIGYGANILTRHVRYDHDHLLLGYSGVIEDGRSAPLPGFPQQVEDFPFFGSPTAADLTGDGLPEVVFGTSHLVRAWSADGEQAATGFPFFHGGWQLGATAIGDIDGDGWLDVVAATREGLVFAWRTDGRADGVVDWATFQHDAARTGNSRTPLPSQAGPPPVEPPTGGSCDGGAAFLLLLLPLRRRYQSRR